MEFPPRLRLLHWEVYPRKFLPRTFCPEHLVELNLTNTELEKLWDGSQPLTNLKKMVLASCLNLKELPDLANATNLERLNLNQCKSLVEVHSSVGNLHKLQNLEIVFCTKLQVVPTLINLASLESVMIVGCYQMCKLPDISTTITELSIPDTMLEEFTESIRLWSHLQCLNIFGCVITYQFVAHPYLRNFVGVRSDIGIERIPDCIKDLHGLKELSILGCPKLASLPELPRSLTTLRVYRCESLETIVPFHFGSEIEDISFPDCFQLGREARRVITQQPSQVCLPGKNIPAMFQNRAIGNFLAIYSKAYLFKVCVVVFPKQEMVENNGIELLCHIRMNGCPTKKRPFSFDLPIQSEHLFIFHAILFKEDLGHEQYRQIFFQFSTTSQDVEIIECGVQILRDKTGRKTSDCRCCEYKSRQQQQQLLDDDDESLNGSLEYDAPRVDSIKDFAKFLSSHLIFLLSLLPSVLFYSLLKKHKDMISDYFTSLFSF